MSRLTEIEQGRVWVQRTAPKKARKGACSGRSRRIITQDENVANLAHRILVIRDGKVVEEKNKV